MEQEQPQEVLKTEGACADVTKISSQEDDTTHKLNSIISVIRKDTVAADLKWSLFFAANQSYKHDFCLRPFPPMFFKDGNKNFKALTEAIECVPAFSQLESLSHTLSKPSIELLYWVLVELKEPSLAVVDKSEVSGVLSLVSCELTAPSPSLVVRLSYDMSSPGELRWLETKEQHGSIHAFHGSKVENFHSIIHHGLQQHLTKNALFGQGVYLSSERLESLPYSRNGFGWRHSSIASELSVLALCEILDHPSVHCQTRGNKSRAMAEGSLTGAVPYKVYVVPNSDLVRVRYLLVYTANPRLLATHQSNQRNSVILTWLNRHKMVTSLTMYMVMLAAIGLSRSPTMFRLWREFCRYFGIDY